MGDTPTHMQAVRSDLRDEIHQLNEKVDAVNTRNQDDHKAIMSQVSELVSDKKALRLVGILMGLALGSVTGTVVYFANQMGDLDEHIEHVEAEERANAKYGFELANGLRRDLDKLEAKVRAMDKDHRDEHRSGPARSK